MTTKESVVGICQTCGGRDEYTVNYCSLSHEMPGYRHALETHVCQECRSKIDSFVLCEHTRSRQRKQAEKQTKKGKKGAKVEAG